MLIRCLEVGPMQANCYLLGCEETMEGITIDPGGEVPLIISEIKAMDLKLKYIVNTHGHIDHIAGNRGLKDATGASLAIHALDAPLLTSLQGGLTFLFGSFSPGPPADILLNEGDQVCFGKVALKVLHTPGHTAGGISLLGEGMVFTGDTLFNLGVGRTDLPGGDFQALVDSIKQKLFTLPEETVVYPGHGPATTIGREKTANPFVS